jgi:protein O-mannosyl-transferase
MIREQKPNKLTILLIYLTLALATFIAYQQIGHNGFVWDDNVLYITNNPHVKCGITWESVFWAFSTPYAGYWHPVTWLSHILDCEFFGLNPFYHHLVNLLLHIVNTLLLFCVLKRMTGAIWRSAFVAAVFALHPLRVESVAWVAERKDLLCGLFWMLTIAAYIRYARRPSIRRYLLVIIAFGLGLMAKPMMVTLPFVLLLLDYWPLRRFQWAGKATSEVSPPSDSANICYRRSTLWRLICEKIPLFILMVASAVVTLIATQKSGTVATLKAVSVDMRIANAIVSYVGYMSKMVYPSRLAILYPYPFDRLLTWQPIVSTIVLAVLTVSVIHLSRQQRHYLIVGWLWYLGTLVPVIGLVQVGSQSMADRYTYLPSIGFFIIVAWGMYELLAKRRYLKVGLAISAGIAVVILLVCTQVQVKYWRDDLTLFGRAFEVTKNNPTMLINLGAAFEGLGKHNEAIICYSEALRFEPKDPSVHYNLADSLAAQGKFNEAISRYRQALKFKPNYPEAHINLGATLLKQGEFDEAINHFQQALQIEPNNPAIYHNLGNVYTAKGKFGEAIGYYRQALNIKPDFALSLNALAWIFATNSNTELQDPELAIELAERAAKLTKYQNATVLDTLAAAHASAGNFSEAVETAEKALQLAESAQQNQLTEQIQNHLQLYKSSEPYIEPSLKDH